MNKSVFGTIIGAALLGMVKSKGSANNSNRSFNNYNKMIKNLRSNSPTDYEFYISYALTFDSESILTIENLEDMIQYLSSLNNADLQNFTNFLSKLLVEYHHCRKSFGNLSRSGSRYEYTEGKPNEPNELNEPNEDQWKDIRMPPRYTPEESKLMFLGCSMYITDKFLAYVYGDRVLVKLIKQNKVDYKKIFNSENILNSLKQQSGEISGSVYRKKKSRFLNKKQMGFFVNKFKAISIDVKNFRDHKAIYEMVKPLQSKIYDLLMRISNNTCHMTQWDFSAMLERPNGIGLYIEYFINNLGKVFGSDKKSDKEIFLKDLIESEKSTIIEVKDSYPSIELIESLRNKIDIRLINPNRSFILQVQEQKIHKIEQKIDAFESSDAVIDTSHENLLRIDTIDKDFRSKIKIIDYLDIPNSFENSNIYLAEMTDLDFIAKAGSKVGNCLASHSRNQKERLNRKQIPVEKFYSIIVEKPEGAYIAMFFLFRYMFEENGLFSWGNFDRAADNWVLKKDWEKNKHKISVQLSYAQVMENRIPMKNAKIGFNPFLALAMVKKKLGLERDTRNPHQGSWGSYIPSEEMLQDIKNSIEQHAPRTFGFYYGGE